MSISESSLSFSYVLPLAEERRIPSQPETMVTQERCGARCSRDPKPIPGTAGIAGRMTSFVFRIYVQGGIISCA